MIILVTINYNDYNTTADFLEKIVKFDAINKIIVVDNNSNDGSGKMLESVYKAVKKVTILLSDKNGGYGYGNNIGIKFSLKYKPDGIIISNPDVLFDEHVVLDLLHELENDKDVAVVAPIMKRRDNKLDYNTAWKIPKNGWSFVLEDAPIVSHIFKSKRQYSRYYFRENKKFYVDAVAGSFFMIRPIDIVNIGCFDESIFLYYEETILSMKLASINKKTLLITYDSFLHYHSKTIKKNHKSEIELAKISCDSKWIVLRKYYGFKESDRILYRVYKYFHLTYAFIKDSVLRFVNYGVRLFNFL